MFPEMAAKPKKPELISCLPTGWGGIMAFSNNGFYNEISFCCIAGSYQWNVVSASLDAGWAHCGSIDNYKTRFSKAVVRKKSGNKFIDTNNSTEDFESDATPTLLK